MLKGIYLLDQKAFNLIYPLKIRQQIEEWVEIIAPPQTKEEVAMHPAILNDADLIFSGWGCPVLSAELLHHAPKLKVVFYGAGSIRYFVTDAFWAKGILVTTAYRANDIPVSEFTLAQIILGLKRYWQHVQLFKTLGTWQEHLPSAGTYQSTVGLISLGMIGQMVAKRLKAHEVQVIGFDPFFSPTKAGKLGVQLCSLDQIFRQADVVSLHTPWLPETEGMITGELIGSMKEGAVLINTARGALIKEDELVTVLRQRPDLYAILDVTMPEPPERDSDLLKLPNVVISPHIAGSMDRECQRNGQLIVEELQRYLAGKAMRYAITKRKAVLMA